MTEDRVILFAYEPDEDDPRFSVTLGPVLDTSMEFAATLMRIHAQRFGGPELTARPLSEFDFESKVSTFNWLNSITRTDPDQPDQSQSDTELALCHHRLKELEKKLVEVAECWGGPSSAERVLPPFFNVPEDDRSLALIELEASTPALRKESGEWISNKQASKLLDVQVDTLSSYRKFGETSSDRMFGRDSYGRIWRRAGTPQSHPWYLRSSVVEE